MAIRTHFCRQWESFRNLLSNRQRDNLSAILNAHLLSRKLVNGKQLIVIITPAPRAAAFVFMWKDVLYLVGGHWLRKGEPTSDFLKLIRGDISRLKKGS